MNNREFILQDFKDNGIRKAKSISTFYKQLERQFGQLAIDFIREVNARGDGGTTGIDIYEIKNDNLSFSDAICSQFDSDRLRQFLARIIDTVTDGQTVLDFGCDNGFMLCCLAKRFPNGKFIGIDINPKAIELARERAQKFKLSNVNFFCGTLEEVIERENLMHFDVVVSGFVFHEIIEPNIETEEPVFSLEELDKCISKNLFEVQELKTLNKCLGTGTLISMDRWGDSESLLFWIRLCEKHGFKLNLSATSLVEFENDGKETVPVTVFTQSSSDCVANVRQILNIRTGLENYVFTQAHYEFESDEAEHANMLLDYERIFEETFEQGPQDQAISLIGLSEKFSLIYQTYSYGGRTLKLYPTSKLKDLWNTLQAYKAMKESMGKISERVLNPDIYKKMIS